MRHRVAFYPCCHRDIEEPLALLAPYAEEVVFCDINSSLLPQWEKIVTRQSCVPHASFLIGDVRQIIGDIKTIDVLFYRGDSSGEGGSGVYVLGDSFLPSILKQFPPEGGLIITDGSNSRGSNFKRMIRRTGMTKHGWSFQKHTDQPYAELQLHIIEVKPSPLAQSSGQPDLAHKAAQGLLP
jgi:hypothetical protein